MKKPKFKLKIDASLDGLEVRQVIRRSFDFSSRLRTKLKMQQLIFHNGKKAQGWHKVKTGDEIDIFLPNESSSFPPMDMKLNIIYEDDDILLINKIPGITVHPTKGCPDGTYANAIMKHMLDKNEQYKIRFINRLDTDTSGLLLVGKNSYAQDCISKQMRENLVHKEYKALVHGFFPQNIKSIDFPIGRPSPNEIRRCVMENGSPSRTVICENSHISTDNGDFSLLQVKLDTGRTHQIRVHLSHLGYPIVGDWLYGGDTSVINRQVLHAYFLSFIHPYTKKHVEFFADLPEDISVLLDNISHK